MYKLDHVNKFISSLKEIARKGDSTEFNTDEIAGFIQDTQTWLIDHIINSCLLPLRECLDVNNLETLSRIQIGTKTIWEKLRNKFEASSYMLTSINLIPNVIYI